MPASRGLGAHSTSLSPNPVLDKNQNVEPLNHAPKQRPSVWFRLRLSFVWLVFLFTMPSHDLCMSRNTREINLDQERATRIEPTTGKMGKPLLNHSARGTRAGQSLHPYNPFS